MHCLQNSHRKVKIRYDRIIGIRNIIRALEYGPLIRRLWAHRLLFHYYGGTLTQDMDDPQWEVFYNFLMLHKRLPIYEKGGCPRKCMLVNDYCWRCGYWGERGHAIVIIGFDLRDPLHPYLIIKNSWGKNWDEGGHCRIEI